jgi:cystathionine gamma-lyase
MDDDSYEFETRQVHAGYEPDEQGAVVPPIYNSVTYAYESPDEQIGTHRYTRMSSPTRAALAERVADLEGGTHCHTFASGMAAINAVFTTVLSSGDHVVAGETLYAESHTLLTRVFAGFSVEVTFVDTTDPAAVEGALRPETALVYLETPTNPLLTVTDIAGVVDAVAASGVDPVVAVDNTFASPYLQRPLELGADVVVESLTKYVAGHSDAMAGAAVTDDPNLDERIGFVQYNLGATPSPYDCSLAFRGSKTLAGRMQTHCENARAVAAFLADHPAVAEVYYPGLESHPNHAVAAEQMRDFGGMVSVELDATLEETSAVVSNTHVFELAESLGAIESLIEQPATMTHQTLTPAELAEAGLSESLIRLSVGIEATGDLLADLERAIETGLA